MPQRVVTLPPTSSGAAALEFARRARAVGAQLLELRTDLLSSRDVDARALSKELPLLVALRGPRAAPEWLSAAAWIDVPWGEPLPEATGARILRSLHAPGPLAPSDAVGAWEREGRTSRVAAIKHVEPLGAPASGARLLQTQRALREKFGVDRVTALATGDYALPFRALLAEGNALDYLALEGGWSAAPGQRLLADAVRACAQPDEGSDPVRGGPSAARNDPAGRGSSAGRIDPAAGSPSAAQARMGILGTRLGGSHSPRIHPQPFDRIDLPEDAPVAELVDALLPFYRGFAITAPFKRVLARHFGSDLPAINTLVRTEAGFRGLNTDVDGALAALHAFGPRAQEPLLVLGDGGAADALRMAAERLGQKLQVLRRKEITRPLSLEAIWTWPPHLPVPERLRFQGQRVGVVAYGEAARTISQEIQQRGGVPLRLGRRWFIAQARAQREHWSTGR